MDERCSIYPVRPAACRKAHSLSAPHCAEQSPTIPQNLRLLVDAEALMAGTALAYRDQPLPASAHELNAAVLAALNDPLRSHGGLTEQEVPFIVNRVMDLGTAPALRNFDALFVACTAAAQ